MTGPDPRIEAATKIVTVSFPPCQPDHPWASIPTSALAHGRCPVCGALLDGEKAARMIRARDLIPEFAVEGR